MISKYLRYTKDNQYSFVNEPCKILNCFKKVGKVHIRNDKLVVENIW